MTGGRRLPPRLVTRALLTSCLIFVVVLAAVFVLVSLETRNRVRENVAANLDAGQQLFARVEGRIEQERLTTVSTLSESPTLKAALDTWQSERRAGGPAVEELVATVAREVQKISTRIKADVLAVTDPQGAVVVSAGPHAPDWPAGTKLPGAGVARSTRSDSVATLRDTVFRINGVPLGLGGVVIGSLELGTALDQAYAQEVATLARAHSAIVYGDRIQATTLPPALADQLKASELTAEAASTIELGGDTWAVRRVSGTGPVTLYAMASVDAAAGAATQSALRGLTWIAGLALAIGMLGSLWLARTLTNPIDRLSRSLTEMTRAREFATAVPAPGTSRELDSLTDTFNGLIRSVAEAQAETQAAYLSAIRALAAALDARDPYTAGHSERVSALSVEIGREMQLGEDDLSVLRLGALLHDIGKIGVPDEILRKPSGLTPEEFELIRAHPVIGARILRTIPFLAGHLPIVELHHERPDGRGYPFGLAGDAIPLTARIVHVADAYDAITSARAYRPARLPNDAIAELKRHAGTDFDTASVAALSQALPRLPDAFSAFDATAFQIAAVQRIKAS